MDMTIDKSRGATIEDIVGVVKKLNRENRKKILYMGYGMSIAEEIDDKRKRSNKVTY